jgi:hypothetical protein
MARRPLEDILLELWPEQLEARGVSDVDETTIKRIVDATAPSIRAARREPDHSAAFEARQQVAQILQEAGYELPPR